MKTRREVLGFNVIPSLKPPPACREIENDSLKRRLSREVRLAEKAAEAAKEAKKEEKKEEKKVEQTKEKVAQEVKKEEKKVEKVKEKVADEKDDMVEKMAKMFAVIEKVKALHGKPGTPGAQVTTRSTQAPSTGTATQQKCIAAQRVLTARPTQHFPSSTRTLVLGSPSSYRRGLLGLQERTARTGPRGQQDLRASPGSMGRTARMESRA